MYNPFQLGKKIPKYKLERKLGIEERRLLGEMTDVGWREYTENMLCRYIKEMNYAASFIESDDPNMSDSSREEWQKKYDKSNKKFNNQINQLRNHLPDHLFSPKPQVKEIEISKLTKEDVFPIN